MAKHILVTQSPEQQWNSAVRDLELMAKSMVRAYTRKDGTLVKEHDNGKPPTSEPDRKTAATGGVKKTRAKANSGLVDSSSDPDFPKEWGNKFKGHEITKDLHQKMLQAHVDAKSNNKIYKYADFTHHGVMDKNGREFMPGTAPAEYAFIKVHSHADHNVPPAYKVLHVKSGKEWYFRDPKHH